MGRTARLEKRAKIGRELLAKRAARDFLTVGYAMELIEWNPPPRRGRWLPFCLGLPVLPLKRECEKLSEKARCHKPKPSG